MWWSFIRFLISRKWPMFASSIGILLSSIAYLSLTYFPDFVSKNLWILLIPSIPMSLFGNWQVFYLCAMSYIGDLNIYLNASERSKTIRYMINQVVCYLAYPAGVFFGGQMLDKWGFFAVFSSSSLLSLVACILILIKIDNTLLKNIMNNGATLSQEHLDHIKQNSDHIVETDIHHGLITGNDESKSSMITQMVKDLFCSIFKKRRGHTNIIVFVLSLATLSTQMSDVIDANVQYLYLKDKLGWNMTTYSDFASASTLIMAISTLLISPFLSYAISDIQQTSIGMLGYVIYAYLCGSLPASDESSTWIYYLYPAAIVTFLGPTVCIVARSYTASHIDSNDLGKVFSVLSFCQSLVPLAISPASATIFSVTLESENVDTGTLYLALACYQFLAFSLTLMADHLSKMDELRSMLEKRYTEELFLNSENSDSGRRNSIQGSLNEDTRSLEIEPRRSAEVVQLRKNVGNASQKETNGIFVPDVFGEIVEIESEKEAVTQMNIIEYLLSKMDHEK